MGCFVWGGRNGMGCFVRGGKNGMGCFVRGDKNCTGCFVGVGKSMRDVLSGMSKNGMGCFVPGCFVLHSGRVDNFFCLICLLKRHGFLITYTMHNKFSNFLCFASLCAHLCAMSSNFKCNDENRILGK